MKLTQLIACTISKRDTERGRKRKGERDGKKREIERKLRGDIKVKNKTRH